DDALPSYRQALALHRELAARGEPGAELDVARTLLGLAHCQYGLKNIAEMRTLANEARGLAEAAGPSEEALRVLADCYATLGQAYRVGSDSKEWMEALHHSERAFVIRQQLAETNPGAALLRKKVGDAYSWCSIPLRQLEKFAEALSAQQKGIEIYETEARTNPRDAELHNLLGIAYNNESNTLESLGKLGEAAAVLAKAVETQQKAIDANRGVTKYKSNQAFFSRNWGETLQRLGRWEEAQQAYGKAASLMQPLMSAYPTRAAYRPFLATITRSRGGALQKLGRPSEAAAAYRESLELLQGLSKPSPGQIYDLACCYALLHGVAPEKGSGLSPSDGVASGAHAVEALHRAIGAGYRDLTKLRKDTNLESLRK